MSAKRGSPARMAHPSRLLRHLLSIGFYAIAYSEVTGALCDILPAILSTRF